MQPRKYGLHRVVVFHAGIGLAPPEHEPTLKHDSIKAHLLLLIARIVGLVLRTCRDSLQEIKFASASR